LTASGESRPVRWLGHRRIDCRRQVDPTKVWPIRIRAGAFRDLMPSRDLWVSPGHAIFWEGVMVQAYNLLNGVTVKQTPCDFIEYWHVELDSHDVLIADGMPAESYLDTGNRAAFANGSVHCEMFPELNSKHWRDTCAPLILDGPRLQQIRQMLLDRARSLGFSITNCSDVHAIADGKRVEAVPLGDNRLAFLFGIAASQIELRCRDFVPAHIDPVSGDRRRLGLCVCRWQLDGVDFDLEGNENFADGWHELESDSHGHHMRWSRDRIPLPTGTRLLVLELAGRGYYWDTASRAEDARRNA
jgi:hypothetical protein